MSSSIGQSVTQGATKRAAASRAYRQERDRTRSWARIAKLVIQRRTVLGITQQQLADRAGTSHSAISRLEAGRQATHLDTLHRVFDALGATLLLGYEEHEKDPAEKEPRRELVAV